MAQNSSKWTIVRAAVERRKDLAKFHIDNHLAISIGSEGEKQISKATSLTSLMTAYSSRVSIGLPLVTAMAALLGVLA